MSAAPQAASATDARSFFVLGIEHILTGFDHLLFLVALLITLTRRSQIIAIVTAFTLAHSITLALATLELLVLPTAAAEPLIALSIIVVCVENFFRREAASDRYWLAAGFGLLHGFGFATILRETLKLTPSDAAPALLSFNLGVEFVQLAFAATLVTILTRLRRQPHFARYAVPVLSGIVALISFYWLDARVAAALAGK